MSAGARIAEDDWTGNPATKGDLMLLKTDLELVKSDLELVKSDLKLVKSDLEHKIDRVESDLGAKIDVAVANLEVKIAEGHRSQARTTWLAVATLGAVGILLQFF